MKKTLLTVLALTASAIGLRAEEPESSYSITTDFTYVSKYVFRGVLQSEASLQPSVLLTSGNLSLGIWSAQAVKDQTAAWAQGNEFDFYGSYAFAFDGGYTVTLGATSYQYPSARPSMGELDSTFETSLGLSVPLGPLSGSAIYFHDFDLDSDTLELSVGYSHEIDDKNSFGVGVSYGSASFDAGGDYDYYSGKFTYSYKLTPKATLNLGFNWADADLAGLDSNTWVSVGVSAGF